MTYPPIPSHLRIAHVLQVAEGCDGFLLLNPHLPQVGHQDLPKLRFVQHKNFALS